ncbi:protein-disulfide isomerase [Novosphingobium fuchskuhlense]|uniref:Protein-disulfide isomerase n=1 Tax=Novosphingobium fuchskuhlense TaxID=1117702 RepID=A0A117UY20_9SPHN|nr:thioredoxin domain-containing protein [Novosphingobium fuchskuhlense]KUR72940.1 protein-disulfide isomerase [Novosphingobium fuchskuhlense]
MRTLLKTMGLFLAALLGVALLTAATKPAAPAPKVNWNNVVVRTPLDSHLLGNPDAPVKLVEYISYTCPHCAHFEEESDAQLRIGFIATGKGSIEVRSFLRDPIDLTVALLTHCGPASKFFGNHSAFLRHQTTWMAPLASLTEAQKARWSNTDFGARTRAIASDLGLYSLMEARGYGRVELDRCLADKGLADRLAKNTKEAGQKDFVNGTPSFLLNGVPLSGTYSWATLKPQLEARLR